MFTEVVKASYWFPDGESPANGSVVPRSSAEVIDSTLFTHLFFAFADLDSQTNSVFVSDAHEHEFSNFTKIVKQKNPHVQTLLSIGGRNADGSAFASMASNPTSRKAFIWSSISIARYYRFNGLDLVWEFPNNEVEMRNFGKLLEEWREAVEDDAERTENMPLLLTAAVYYSPSHNSVSYPIQEIDENLDWVNLIAYDFYGSTTIISPPAALFDPSNPPKGPCGDSGLKEWIKAGLPEKKAVLGFPYVGWAWCLEGGHDEATTQVATSADGTINYDQIRKFIVDNGATTVYNSTVVGDYCYAGTTWIGYDDYESIVTKVSYAKQRGLLGYFSWHVGADDNFILSRAASKAWDQC
ncbi:PREDICTED: chitotriosidase-1-like [Camelina sativa]|uniref:Chitotriosidase-1-like n=1 Tax=Camelina sativa TaxID=90675 RepID=A0ABM0Y6P2_CAMSA|nr:PREDICTED: chitotriosidase-1-like [Camelina sativa]